LYDIIKKTLPTDIIEQGNLETEQQNRTRCRKLI